MAATICRQGDITVQWSRQLSLTTFGADRIIGYYKR
jgi:hypothetical protein